MLAERTDYQIWGHWTIGSSENMSSRRGIPHNIATGIRSSTMIGAALNSSINRPVSVLSGDQGSSLYSLGGPSC